MYISQVFLLLSAVATSVVAQRSMRPGDYCRTGIWGCGNDNGVPYVGTCDSRNTWSVYDYCNDNRVCESKPGVQPKCVEPLRSPEFWKPGSRCESGIWGCGNDNGVPYVGMCDSRNIWSVYDYCNDNRVCEPNPDSRPKCVEPLRSPEFYRPGSRC